VTAGEDGDRSGRERGAMRGRVDSAQARRRRRSRSRRARAQSAG
jgi:hypothetical protein